METVDNYDPPLYWFEKLEQHPNPAIAEAVVSVSKLLAAELGIPVPEIIWFAPADQYIAGEEFSRCGRENAHQGFGITDDPISMRCKYFRFLDGPGMTFAGYTPSKSPGKIMLASDQPLLGAISALADECKHLWQDKTRGNDWREANFEEAEAEADDFQKHFMKRFSAL